MSEEFTAGLGLALMGLLKGTKAHQKARQYNQLVDITNQGLPREQMIAAPKMRFNFGDIPTQYQALQDARKQRLEQLAADYISQHTGMAAGPYQAIEKVYTGQVAPVQAEEGKLQMRGQYGRKALGSMPYVMDQIQQSFPDPMANPVAASIPPPQAGSQLVWDNGVPTFSAGASQTNYVPPDIPEDVYVTPDMVNQYAGRFLQNRDANTRRERLDFDQQKWEDQQPTREAQLNLTQKRIDKIAQDLRLNPKLVQARINKLNQRPQGRAPSRFEILQSLVRSGDISRQEYIDAVRGNSGADDLLDDETVSPPPATPTNRPVASRSGSTRPAARPQAKATTASGFLKSLGY